MATTITPKTDLNELPRFADERGHNINPGRARIYLYDLDTRMKLVDHLLNGAALVGVGAMVAHRGLHVRGSARSCDVVVYTESGPRYGRITTATFNGRRVAVKIRWSPDNVEWRFLAEGDGSAATDGSSPPTDIPAEALVTRWMMSEPKTELRGDVYTHRMRKGLSR